MRILLVQPNFQGGIVGFRVNAFAEPLALEMLAALVPDHDCEILDTRVDGDLQGALERFAPDVVATTALTTEVYEARKILATAKRFSPDIFTVVGGHHATLLPQDFCAPYVDAVGMGEGEMAFPALIRELGGARQLRHVPNLVWRDPDRGYVCNSRVFPSRDLDTLPLPRRDLVARYRPEYFWLFHQPDTCVATSQGCSYRCNFCSVWQFYEGRTRQMTARRVLEEIKAVESLHMTFVDDNFMLNFRREKEIVDLLEAEGIKHRYSMECRADSIARHPELIEQWVKNGLYGILVGLEGGSDKMLGDVNKKISIETNNAALKVLRDHGVITWGSFIVDPDWDLDDFKALRDYMNKQDISFMQITVLTPLPGTQLYEKRKHELLTHDYRCYDNLHAILPTRLPREEFYQQYARLYQQPTFGPYYDLISQGRMTMEQYRLGSRWIKTMSNWESFLPNDPILGHLEPVPPLAEVQIQPCG